MEKEKKLKGLDVVYFESRHSKTLGDLIALQGGRPVAAPAMKEVPIEDNAEALAFADKLFKKEIDVLVLLTGVGTRALVTVLETRHPRKKVLEALHRTTIVPRGPKPIRVLNEWGIPFALTVPEPNTWRELLSALDEHKKDLPLSGKNVAVQEYGVSNPELLEGLEARGARVLRVPVYRWALPDDIRPLTEAVTKMVAGEVQVAVFTTAVQAEHLFQVAEKMKLADALKKAFARLVVASVGPDCSEALRNRGIEPDIEPESPKMGPLIAATAERAAEIWRAKPR